MFLMKEQSMQSLCSCWWEWKGGGQRGTRHLDTKLLPLSMEELDMSMLYILRNFGLARSLVLGMHSGIPSRSSKVDWRENSVVA